MSSSPEDMSKGLWQELPEPEWPDYDKFRAELAAMTPDEQIAAAMRYTEHKLAQDIPADVIARQVAAYEQALLAYRRAPASATAEDSAEDAGTQAAAPVYDKRISRTTGGSDPLVPEPGP